MPIRSAFISVSVSAIGEHDRWLSQHFTWTSLEHFGSNLYYGVNCSVGDPALTKRIEGLGTRMRWFRPHEQRVVCLWCFSVVLHSQVFSVSLSVWPRESEMRGKGVGTRLLLTVLCAQVSQRGYQEVQSEVQSESERRHGIQMWVWFENPFCLVITILLVRDCIY